MRRATRLPLACLPSAECRLPSAACRWRGTPRVNHSAGPPARQGTPLTPRRASPAAGDDRAVGQTISRLRNNPASSQPLSSPRSSKSSRPRCDDRPPRTTKSRQGPSFRPRGGGEAHAGEAPSSRGSTLRTRCPQPLVERRRSRSCLCAAPAVYSSSSSQVPSPKSQVPSPESRVPSPESQDQPASHQDEPLRPDEAALARVVHPQAIQVAAGDLLHGGLIPPPFFVHAEDAPIQRARRRADQESR
jgi:hypothetical protein